MLPEAHSPAPNHVHKHSNPRVEDVVEVPDLPWIWITPRYTDEAIGAVGVVGVRAGRPRAGKAQAGSSLIAEARDCWDARVIKPLDAVKHGSLADLVDVGDNIRDILQQERQRKLIGG